MRGYRRVTPIRFRDNRKLLSQRTFPGQLRPRVYTHIRTQSPSRQEPDQAFSVTRRLAGFALFLDEIFLLAEFRCPLSCLCCCSDEGRLGAGTAGESDHASPQPWHAARWHPLEITRDYGTRRIDVYTRLPRNANAHEAISAAIPGAKYTSCPAGRHNSWRNN